MFITRYLHVNHVDVLVHASSQSFLTALLDPGRWHRHMLHAPLLRGACAVVSSMTFASHKDIPLFPRLDSCFVGTHVNPSFRHLSGVQKNMKKAGYSSAECGADCCAVCLLSRVKFAQCRRRLVTQVHHSVWANNTAWRLAFSRRLLRRRLCELFVPTDQHPAKIKISRRVVFVFRLCAVASISSTIK